MCTRYDIGGNAVKARDESDQQLPLKSGLEHRDRHPLIPANKPDRGGELAAIRLEKYRRSRGALDGAEGHRTGRHPSGAKRPARRLAFRWNHK